MGGLRANNSHFELRGFKFYINLGSIRPMSAPLRKPNPADAGRILLNGDGV